ncbi:MAG: trypsin-like peptidase domain-containing protein [Gemmataceae bacterium]
MMPGVNMKEIRDAILDAYDPQTLAMSLKFLMDERLANITPPGPFDFVVFSLIQWSDQNGRDVELVQSLGKDRPRNARMQQVYRKYGLAVPIGVQQAGGAKSATDAADGGLEKIVRPLLAVPDFGLWREKMTRVEGQVCRITLNGNAQGTGFLVGPDAILTNYHVMKPVIDGLPSGAVECQFDFKLLKNGTAPYTPIKLAADWLIDHSPYSDAEYAGTPDAKLPTPEELDYALIRLADSIGDRPWAKSPDASGNAPNRGWVRVPDVAVAFAAKMAIIIAQHPDGQPMKLALDTDAIDQARGFWLNANGTRVRYATNTEGGSSGSPCFDFDWGLVALHHYGDPKANGSNLKPLGNWNQGVPIGMIRDRLTRQNKAAALGGDGN